MVNLMSKDFCDGEKIVHAHHAKLHETETIDSCRFVWLSGLFLLPLKMN